MTDTFEIQPIDLASMTFPCTVYEVSAIEYDSSDNPTKYSINAVQALSCSRSRFTLETRRSGSTRRGESPANWFHKSESDAKETIRLYKQEYTPPYKDLVDLWGMLVSEAENEPNIRDVVHILRKAKDLLPPEE